MERYDRIGSPVSIQHISYPSYQVGGIIGQGATSDVYMVESCSSKKVYACKSIITTHTSPNSLLKEIILGRLLDHPNILKQHKILMPSGYGNMNRVNVLYPYLNTNLRVFIHNSHCYHENIRYCKRIMNEILQGVHYLHSVGVIHRDLKPDNILLDNNFHVKIADFGLSCFRSDQIDYNQEVVTYNYRSPEVFIRDEYDESIDMWSVGCIFAEMILGEPLINGRIKLSSQFEKLHNELDKILYGADPQLIDLIKKLLEFDPEKRITAFQALNHPFFTNDDIFKDQLPLWKYEKIDFYNKIDYLSYDECISEINREISSYW